MAPPLATAHFGGDAPVDLGSEGPVGFSVTDVAWEGLEPPRLAGWFGR
jgi:hypothetical protein